MADQQFFTYILECQDGTFYTGWTTDVTARVDKHNTGKASKYTRARLPVKLLGYWQFETKSEAMKFEYWIKQLPRPAKEQLINDKTRGKPLKTPLSLSS